MLGESGLNFLLVFNPSAGAGRARRLLTGVESGLRRFGRVTTLLTEAKGHATQLVTDSDLSACDAVIAAGGDGTLFEVLNGLYRHEKGQRKPLGLVPVGTGNAFARDLGLLPGNWQQGVELIGANRTQWVDVGRVTTRQTRFHFLNIVGAGLPVDAMKTAAHLKLLGNPAYSIATLWQALWLKSYPLRLVLDGEPLDRDSMFVEVSNTRYTGTTFLIAPAAKLDDGLLDVTLVSRLPRMRLLRLFPSIYSGQHVNYPEVMTRQVREIRIEAPEGLVLAPDGELYGNSPATITCLPRDLEIFC